MLLGVIQHQHSQAALFAPPHTYEHKFCSHFLLRTCTDASSSNWLIKSF